MSFYQGGSQYPGPSSGTPPSSSSSSSSDFDLVSALSQPTTQPALKANAAIQAVEPLSRLLLSPDSDLAAIKVGLAGFATAYPFLFRYASQSGDHAWWTRVINLKTATLQQWRSGSMGAKVAAVKVLQRIIQTQSTAGTADPRLARNPEPNLSLVRPNHPFLKIAALEDEANKLLSECITTLFTSSAPDLVGAIVVSLATLIKHRPQYVKLVVTSLTNWTPAALVGQGAAQVKSVEKVVRISLNHLVKNSHVTAYSQQISDSLALQARRMEVAAAEARRAREEEASRKRALLASQIDDGGNNKRRRLNPGMTEDTTSAFRSANLNPGTATPSIAELPLETVVDLLVATLQNVNATVLSTAIDTVRRNLPPPTSAPDSASVTPRAASPPPAATTSGPVVDPLKLDLGADELDLRPEVPPEPTRAASEEAEGADGEGDAANQVVSFSSLGAARSGGLSAEELDLAVPLEMTLNARHGAVLSALRRVCAAGPDGASEKVWVPLVSRLITRGLEIETQADAQDGVERDDAATEAARKRGDEFRDVLFKFVTGDLQARTELARLWLNEEWYASKRREVVENRPYDYWLRRFLEHVGVTSSNKDRELLQFLMDLPEIPADEIYRLEGMALNADQMQLGFSTLRELVVLRRSVRPVALDVLLGLATHADKRVRNAAIMTVKKWVPDMAELTPAVHAFALELVDRLKVAPPQLEQAKAEGEEGETAGDKDGEEDMKVDEVTPQPEDPKEPFALVRGGKVVDRLDPPTTIGGVTQHVELLLALCVKEPALLFPLFERYGSLQVFAQEALEELIAPLIRSLGLKHEGLLDLVGRFPPGSDKLMFRVLEIAADKSKLPSNVIGLIRQVAAERELDARFYPIILPECSKAEVIRWLPHVIKLLDGTPLKKAQTRSIFLSIIAPPAHFSSINSLRTRSDSITPVELMMYLHKHDKEMGLKNTIEAISICFSMADGFRPEILAAFMQQVVDEPVIPNLFLRTVIQAVTTYKSLQPFVSTTLLSRLIAKKVWTVGPLWEGFIRLAKAIAPNSFAALLQLPKEQLAEVVTKQPSLREPLRDYVVKKGGANNARTQAVLEAISEAGPSATATTDATPSSGNSTPVPQAMQA